MEEESESKQEVGSYKWSHQLCMASVNDHGAWRDVGRDILWLLYDDRTWRQNRGGGGDDCRNSIERGTLAISPLAVLVAEAGTVGIPVAAVVAVGTSSSAAIIVVADESLVHVGPAVSVPLGIGGGCGEDNDCQGCDQCFHCFLFG